jgi:hypothetical protein
MKLTIGLIWLILSCSAHGALPQHCTDMVSNGSGNGISDRTGYGLNVFNEQSWELHYDLYQGAITCCVVAALARHRTIPPARAMTVLPLHRREMRIFEPSRQALVQDRLCALPLSTQS